MERFVEADGRADLMNIREKQEQTEMELLSPYATQSIRTKGRKKPEVECEIRTCFQRDRDRIVHCKAFRRLKDKTQVFLSPFDDHFRTRLTHTLEVSQIGRTIARALDFNEDLVEAIALGHDLGHTPFGHCGEGVLNELVNGGFHHNIQSVRVVEVLEHLNLCQETIDGILTHTWGYTPKTPEAQIVQLADKIAYINHDIDDAIRAKIFSEDDIPKIYTSILGNSTKTRLNTMINDIVLNSMDKNDIVMSEEIGDAMQSLRQFMFGSLYLNPTAKSEEVKAYKLITELYEYYMNNIDALPDNYKMFIEKMDEPLERVVCDYIAGMSDQYSVAKFEEIFVPASWKV